MIGNRLQRAIDRFDLREYVHEHFDDIREAAGGEEMRVCCFAPEGCAGVDDTKHKLYINPEKKKWICFKCGYGKRDTQPGTGSLIRFMADVEGKHPVQIRARLLDMVEPTPTEEFADVLRMAFEAEETQLSHEPKYIKMPKQFMKLRDTGTSRVAQGYLAFAKERGLNARDLEDWDLRFCPVVPSKKSPIAHWKGRLIFPVFDREGKLRSAVGRALPSRVEKTPWVNWPESDIGELLWPLGYYSNDRWIEHAYCTPHLNHAVLTEGIFDAIATLNFCGRILAFRTFCTFGKKISDGQIDLLRQVGVKEVTIAWDRDAKTEIQAAAEKLSAEFNQVLVFPFNSSKWENHDLGDTLRGRVPPELIEKELNAAIDVQSNEFIAWLFH